MLRNLAMTSKFRVQLNLISAYGITQPDLPGTFTVINDNCLVYLVGSSLIYKNISTNKHMNFNKEGFFEDIFYIDSFTDPANNKPYVIVAERREDHTLIVLLDLDEDKWTECKIPQQLIVKSIKVNLAIKTFFILTDLDKVEEQYIFIWSMQKRKVIGKLPLKHRYDSMDVHPTRLRTLLLFSSHFVKLFEFKPQNRNLVEKINYLHNMAVKTEWYIDFCWVVLKTGCYLILLTNNNSFTIFLDDKFMKRLRIDLTSISFSKLGIDKSSKSLDDIFELQQDEEGGGRLSDARISKLVGQDKGFLFATDNLHFCYCKIHNTHTDAQSNNHIYVVQGYFIQLEKNQKKDLELLYDLSASPKSSIVALVTKDQNAAIDHYVLNLFSLDNYKAPLQRFFPIGLHRQSIHRLSASRSKQLFSSIDPEVGKIWPIEDGDFKNVEIISNEEKLMDIALHPSGMFVAAATFTGFKVFALLDDCLRLVRSVKLVWCTLVRYSKRARYLLVNEKSSVCIYDAIHYNLIQVFSGHSKLIKEIFILEDEYRVLSYCNERYLLFWEIQEKDEPSGRVSKEKRDQIVVHRHTAKEDYHAFLYDEKHEYFIATSDSNNIIVYKDNCKEFMFRYVNPDYKILALAIDNQNQLLYAGTDKGVVKIYHSNFNFIDTPIVHELLSVEIRIGRSPLTQILICGKNDRLVVAGDTGSIMVFNIERHGVSFEDPNNDKNIVEEMARQCYLINDLKLRDDMETIRQLEGEAQRLHRVKAAELGNLKEKFEETLRETNQKYDKILIETKEKHVSLKNHENEEILTKAEKLKIEKETADNIIHTIKSSTNELISYEEQRNQSLRDQHGEQIAERLRQLETAGSNYEKALLDSKTDMDKELDFLIDEYITLQKRATEYGSKFMHKITMEEEDYEMELQKFTTILEREYEKERTETAHIAQENRNLQLMSSASRQQDKNGQKKIQELIEQNTLLLEEKVHSCLALLKMEEQLLEKEQVLMHKEGAVKSALDVQKSLENFRYILEHKIKEFEGEKEGLVAKVKSKETALKSLFAELVQQSELNSRLQRGLSIGLAVLSVIEAENEYLSAAGHLNLFKNLRQKVGAANGRLALKKVYDEFVAKEYITIMSYDKGNIFDKDEKIEHDHEFNEYNDRVRQNNLLCKDIAKFAKKIEASKTKFRHDVLLSVNKNKNLIEECNKLQIENDYYNKLLQELSNSVHEAKRVRNRIYKNRKPAI